MRFPLYGIFLKISKSKSTKEQLNLCFLMPIFQTEFFQALIDCWVYEFGPDITDEDFELMIEFGSFGLSGASHQSGYPLSLNAVP